MLKNNSSLTDSRMLIAVGRLPEKREFFTGQVVPLPSRWPFRVEGTDIARRVLSAEGQSAAHQECSSFIT